MQRILLHWVLSALAIWVVSQLVPGFIVTGASAALIAAVVIGFINATIGMVLKLITLPLTIITFGLFWFIINALMIELAAQFIPGFAITSFAAAFWGGIALGIVSMLMKAVLLPKG